MLALVLLNVAMPLCAQEKPVDRALEKLLLPPKFTATVFAQPPEVSHPVSVSAAPDGKTVFVAVDENGSLGADPGKGRVVRCVDVDGDGKADSFTTFAKMDTPRGVIWESRGKGGVLYVMHSPKLTAYYDETGSGVAQRSEDLVTGLGFDLNFRGGDHTTNSCRLGIDGWIYIAVGDYGAVAAVGKDGASVQMKGGGVVRVRTDGSGLEIVSNGQRNICDVAISPTLDLFTRDNTNDGDGWNDRLSHVVPGAHYGYPSLFKNFAADCLPALADYGGGSPCGALWLDEPALPEGWQEGLFTVEWGKGTIEQHPLTARGASWEAGLREFIKVPRPTDIEADGMGHLFVTSWDGGGFTYSSPHVGYVLRLSGTSPTDAKTPDLTAMDDQTLFGVFTLASGSWRLAAQREILQRGPRFSLADALGQFAGSTYPLPVRVAAIFTLKQLLGERSHPALLELLKNDDVREFALKALADDTRLAAKITAQPFTAALTDLNPRVRLQAVSGLGRLQKKESAGALIPLTADPDFTVAHLATRTLVSLGAYEACLAALDTADARIKPGVLRALYGMYDIRVVRGLVARLPKAQGDYRRGILTALCRLNRYETAYEAGKWWGTRPDTTGPFYKGDKWEGSKLIRETMGEVLQKASDEEARWLVLTMFRCKMNNFPNLVDLVLAKVGTDTIGKLDAVESMFDSDGTLPPVALSTLTAIVANEHEPPELRVRALRLVERAGSDVKQFDAVLAAFAPFAGRDLPQPPHSHFAPVYEEFTHDPQHRFRIAELSALVTDADPGRRALAQTILMHLALRPLGKPQENAACAAALEAAWKQPGAAATLLGVIARTGARSYAGEVKRRLNDPNPTVAEAALYAFQKLDLKSTDEGVTQAPIADLKYEDVVAQAVKMPGDAALGRTFFLRQGCSACHTISPDEPAKGPMLAGIATRYSREQLVESILRPDAVIAQGFEAQWFETKRQGRVEGFVTRSGADTLTIGTAAGESLTIPLGEILNRGKRETSIMPSGLVGNLRPAGLADLLAYLESLPAK
jgi:putative heme-binding domain-containing protein